MGDSFLITRPDHDDTTRYLYVFCEKIVKKASQLGKKFIDLKKKKANLREFLKSVKIINPLILILNGHGNENVVTGFNNKTLIEKDRNDNLLKERITSALSCQSAKKLGPSAVKKGALAYIGYDEDFIFLIEENKISTPLSDKTAGQFLNPAIDVPLSLLSGSTAKKAYQKSQNSFRKIIRKLQSSDTGKAEKEAILYLLWDKNHQVCLTK